MEIDHCPLITDDGIGAFGLHQGEYVSNNRKTNDCENISAVKRQLIRLKLASLKKVTDEGIRKLIEGDDAINCNGALANLKVLYMQ